MSDFLAALGLVLVIEGLVYFAFAGRMKSVLAALDALPASTLRAGAFTCAVLGLALLWLVRG